MLDSARRQENVLKKRVYELNRCAAMVEIAAVTHRKKRVKTAGSLASQVLKTLGHEEWDVSQILVNSAYVVKLAETSSRIEKAKLFNEPGMGWVCHACHPNGTIIRGTGGRHAAHAVVAAILRSAAQVVLEKLREVRELS